MEITPFDQTRYEGHMRSFRGVAVPPEPPRQQSFLRSQVGMLDQYGERITSDRTTPERKEIWKVHYDEVVATAHTLLGHMRPAVVEETLNQLTDPQREILHGLLQGAAQQSSQRMTSQLGQGQEPTLTASHPADPVAQDERSA